MKRIGISGDGDLYYKKLTSYLSVFYKKLSSIFMEKSLFVTLKNKGMMRIL